MIADGAFQHCHKKCGFRLYVRAMLHKPCNFAYDCCTENVRKGSVWTVRRRRATDLPESNLTSPDQ
jgi:hypothetical protein